MLYSRCMGTCLVILLGLASHTLFSPSVSASATTPAVFDLTLEERILLEKREPGLRNAVTQAVEEYGDSSREKAKALHSLGSVLYKLEKYAGLRSSAKEIARIEEDLTGPDSTKLALALRNVGSVAYRLELHEESVMYMMRSLNIWLHHFEEGSKEVTYHKSIMFTFGQEKEYTKYPLGMPYKQFKKIEKEQKQSAFVLDEL